MTIHYTSHAGAQPTETPQVPDHEWMFISYVFSITVVC